MSATGFVTAFVLGLGILVVGFLFYRPAAAHHGFHRNHPALRPLVYAHHSDWRTHMTASLVLNNQLRFQGSAPSAR